MKKQVDQEAVSVALQCGYDCYAEMIQDPNHRYLSWEYCHEVFKQYRQGRSEADIDYLCLHLAWYLASWGMLRNSFLMQKDYKIHANVVRLIYQPEWDELWELPSDKLAEDYYAGQIMKLYRAIAETYKESGAGEPTDTLLTKILLGTLGCVPAYDNYFKKGLSYTGAATQTISVNSLKALGNLYIEREEEFEKLKGYCSKRVEYPSAKIIDMCIFEYGLRKDAEEKEGKKP